MQHPITAHFLGTSHQAELLSEARAHRLGRGASEERTGPQQPALRQLRLAVVGSVLLSAVGLLLG